MRCVMKTRPIVLVLAIFAAQFANVECAAQSSNEQTTFCEGGVPDGSGLKPAPIPKEVIDAVMRSEGGKEARAFPSGTALNPEKLLRGTPLQLSNDGTTAFLLMGSIPLSGVDNTWFWIVRESGYKASVLLWVGANCVKMMPTNTNGYRDVVSVWSSAADTLTETYKYDGKIYRLARKVTKSRRPE